MKVPTYTSQSALSGKSGGKMFNVQASPAGFSQVASAFKNFADTTSKVAYSLYEAEVKTKRAGELAAAQNEYSTDLNQYALNSLNDNDPKSIIANWNNNTKLSMVSISDSIEDPVVKRRFNSWASDTTTEKTLNVMKVVRAKQIDIAKSHFIEREIYLKDRIANGSRVEKASATIELFGDPETNTIGLYEEMASLGLITNTEAVTSNEAAISDIAELEVRTLLSSIKASKNPEKAGELLLELMEGKSGEYPDLDDEDRNTLISQVSTLENSLISQINAENREQARIDEEAQIKRHNEGLAKVLQSLDGPTPMLFDELEVMFKNDEISSDDYKYLRQKMLGGTTDIDDGDLYTDLHRQILQATDDEELDHLFDTIKNQTKLNKLTKESSASLTKAIFEQRDDTDLAKEKKKYSGLIDKLTANIPKESYDASVAGILHNEARILFDRIISDPNSKMTPKAAYDYVADLYLDGMGLGVSYIPLSDQTRNFILRMNPELFGFKQDSSTRNDFSIGGDFNFENWTSTHFIGVEKFIRNDAESGLSVFEQTLEYETLLEARGQWETMAIRRRTPTYPNGFIEEEIDGVTVKRMLTKEEYDNEMLGD